MTANQEEIKVEVTQVHHDLIAERSLVVLTWPGEPRRQLRLRIPFGTPLDRIHVEAERALRDHEEGIHRTTVAENGSGT
jgi:hypothetical protein